MQVILEDAGIQIRWHAFAPGHELQPGAQKANLAKAETWNDLRGCGWALFYCVGFAVMVFTASWVRHKFG
ncbi:MAG TPA: hypothetical protein VGM86_15875 [Thermoanaerobaculia bacterium]